MLVLHQFLVDRGAGYGLQPGRKVEPGHSPPDEAFNLATQRCEFLGILVEKSAVSRFRCQLLDLRIELYHAGEAQTRTLQTGDPTTAQMRAKGVAIRSEERRVGKECRSR